VTETRTLPELLRRFDLTGRAVRSLIELPAHHDPEAHTRSYVEVDEIVDVATQPAPPLAEGSEIHVVLEDDRGGELPPDLVQDPLARPAGKVVGEQGMSGRPEHARAAHRRHRDPAPPDARGPGGGASDGADRRDQRPRAPGPGCLPPLRDDRTYARPTSIPTTHPAAGFSS